MDVETHTRATVTLILMNAVLSIRSETETSDQDMGNFSYVVECGIV